MSHLPGKIRIAAYRCRPVILGLSLFLFLFGYFFLFSEVVITREPLDSCFYYFSAIQKPDGGLGSLSSSINYPEHALGVFVFLQRKDYWRAKKVLLFLQQELKKTGDLNYSPAEKSSESESENDIIPDPELTGKLWYILAVMNYYKVSGDKSFLTGVENLGYKIAQYLTPDGGLVSFNRANSRMDFRDNILAAAAFASLGQYNRYFQQLASRVRYFVENYFDPNNLTIDEQLFAGLSGIKLLSDDQIKNFSSLTITQRSILATITRRKEEIEFLRKNLVISPDYPGSLGLADDFGQISLIATAFYIFAEQNFNPLAGEKFPTIERTDLAEKFSGDDFEMWSWKLPFIWQFRGQNCQINIDQSRKEHHSGKYSLAIDFFPEKSSATAVVWRQFISEQDFTGYESISLWLKGQRTSGYSLSSGAGSPVLVQLFLTNKQGQEFFSRPLILGGSNGFVNTVLLPTGLELSSGVKDLALRQVKRVGVKITASGFTGGEGNWKIYLDDIKLK